MAKNTLYNVEPRKSPRQKRGMITREFILQATENALSKRGWANFTTTMVAKIAGIGVGSLYQYFPNKESLIAALIERIGRHKLNILENVLRDYETAPLPEVADALIGAYMDYYRTNPSLQRIIHREILRLGRDREIDKLERQAMQMLERFLEKRSQELNLEDTHLAAFIGFFTVENLFRTVNMQRPQYLSDPTFRKELVRLLLRYGGYQSA